MMAITSDNIARTDEAILEDVLSELSWDPRITAAADIAVSLADGVVTLSGFLPNYSEKEEAERVAKRVFGVRGVANDTEVKPPSPAPIPRFAREAFRHLPT